MARCECPWKGKDEECPEYWKPCPGGGISGKIDDAINFETAKKLKEAGLEWETETGDFRLDQLLTEIEKRGWQIELVKYARWRITIWKIQCRKQRLFVRETPGEAAAEALLHVLEQEYEADE